MSVLGPNIPDNIDSRFGGLIDANESGWFQKELKEYFKGFPVSSDDTTLDVGCGEGPATLFFAECGASVIFTDIDEQNVTETTWKLQALEAEVNFQGIVSDSDPILLDDGSVTRVNCTEVLEHVDDPAQVMAELVRVGKPGALYLLSVPGTRGEHIQKTVAPKEYFEKPNHLRIFSKEDFTQLVENAGLEIQSYDSTGFFWVMWMAIYWAVKGVNEAENGGEVINDKRIAPPFDDSLNRWTSLWVKLISTPQGLAFKHEMDKLLPKNQVIVARKPN